jgi:hypothetical protein
LQEFLLDGEDPCFTIASDRVLLCFHCNVASFSIPIPAFIPLEHKCCDAFLYARTTFEEPARSTVERLDWGEIAILDCKTEDKLFSSMDL